MAPGQRKRVELLMEWQASNQSKTIHWIWFVGAAMKSTMKRRRKEWAESEWAAECLQLSLPSWIVGYGRHQPPMLRNEKKTARERAGFVFFFFLTSLIHLLFSFHSTLWNEIKKMRWLPILQQINSNKTFHFLFNAKENEVLWIDCWL